MPIIGRDILDIGFDGIISSAGGHVEVEGKVLFDSLLPEETVQECLSVFHEHDIYCRIEGPEGIYTDPQMEALLKAAKPDEILHIPADDIRHFLQLVAGVPHRYTDMGILHHPIIIHVKNYL